MIPIWNDLGFPLVMASGDDTKTVTLGIQAFTGQFQTNWSALLAALSLAMIPVLLIYVIFSRQDDSRTDGRSAETMKASAQLRIGLIGAGSMGWQHAAGWQATRPAW